jgi:hypothetical protein
VAIDHPTLVAARRNLCGSVDGLFEQFARAHA